MHRATPSYYSDLLAHIGLKWGKSSHSKRSSSKLTVDDGTVTVKASTVSSASGPAVAIKSAPKTLHSESSKAEAAAASCAGGAAASSDGPVLPPALPVPAEPPNPDVPPPPDKPVIERPTHTRRKPMHPRSFHYGPHLMSYRPGVNGGSWSAMCGRSKGAHKKPGHTTTMCTKFMSFKGKDV